MAKRLGKYLDEKLPAKELAKIHPAKRSDVVIAAIKDYRAAEKK